MKCCVPLCEQRSEKFISESNSETEEVSFHEIPTTQSIRHSWLESIGVNENCLPEDPVVCSQHFQKDDFHMTECGSNKLRNNSIPSAFRSTSDSAVQFCMICLDTAGKLCPFNEYLTNAYSDVTGLSKSLREINSAPKLCTECAQRLTNCYKFKDKSLSAHNLLLQLYKEHGTLTIENIKTINRVEYQLTSNIVKHAIKPDHCDLYIKDLDEDKNIQEETICNTVQYTEVKIEPSEDIVLDTKVKEEAFVFDIDNEAYSYNVQVRNNDLRRIDVKCLDDDIENDLDHDMDSLNDYDSCVKYLNENSKVQDTEKIKIVTVIHKNSESTPNKNVLNNKSSINLTNTKFIKDTKPKIRNKRKKVSSAKDRKKTTKSDKKLCSKDEVSVAVKKNKLKLVKSNEKLVPDDVKNVIKRRTRVAKLDKLSNPNDANNKDCVKPKTQDCSDLKLFTVTVLTYVEQLAEVQRRKDTDGYIRAPYKCTICHKGYWYTVPYNRHMEKHTD
ncbi:jg9956, partial [Pararge aegeria aegeria]